MATFSLVGWLVCEQNYSKMLSQNDCNILERLTLGHDPVWARWSYRIDQSISC